MIWRVKVCHVTASRTAEGVGQRYYILGRMKEHESRCVYEGHHLTSWDQSDSTTSAEGVSEGVG